MKSFFVVTFEDGGALECIGVDMGDIQHVTFEELGVRMQIVFDAALKALADDEHCGPDVKTRGYLVPTSWWESSQVNLGDSMAIAMRCHSLFTPVIHSDL